MLAHLRAEQALEPLARLKTYTLPVGRMPVVRELALRIDPLRDADSEIIACALEDFERELIGLGGAPDAKLCEAVAMVEATFPDAHLIDVRRRKSAR